MVKELSIAYECINAIGNSLNLQEMISEVLTTFVRRTGAVGGIYSDPSDTFFVGRNFEFSLTASREAEFSIHNVSDGSILEVPISTGCFYFLYRRETDLEQLGNMFSNFRKKLSNSIDACRNVERLKHQVSEEKTKNAVTEKLMISQSRMAIMGEMLGMIAHQWRQPITVIGMITNNTILDIEIGEFNQERLRSDLELIDKQVHFLSHTIDDFRNFFRPNKLPQSVIYQEIPLELTSIIGKSFENHRIALTFEGDMNITFVTYKNELLQVLLNLLNNAKDAFEDSYVKDPKITLSLSRNNRRICFMVRDNAGGIPLSIISHIFEPYFSTKSEKNGTGLGLYMSSVIVEKHLGGSIRVCSDTDETTFVIQLPETQFQRDTHVY